MSKNIKFGGRCDESNRLLQSVLPGFVLTLRDFPLRLVKEVTKLTEDEYLEKCLEDRIGRGVYFNKPRESIRKLFPNFKRKCFAFPVPGDGDVLEKLDSLTFDELSPKFKNVAELFVSHIYSQGPKQLQISKPVNGSMFATLTRKYVDALAKGAVLDVDDAFEMVAKIENGRVKGKCMDLFHSKMREIQLPLSAPLLDKHFNEAKLSALDYMRRNAFNDVANVVERDAQNREYEVIGGHTKFKRDIGMVRQEYEQTLHGYELRERDLFSQDVFTLADTDNSMTDLGRPASDILTEMRNTTETSSNLDDDYEDKKCIALTWRNFSRKLDPDEKKIIEKDNELSEEQKQREKDKTANLLARMKEEIAEENQKAQDQQKKELLEQQKMLRADREQREKEHERLIKALHTEIASLETNKEDQHNILTHMKAMADEIRSLRCVD
ncbi:guanylate-binding protein 6-like [Mya arenaria]|uniref:guanylate-binding protein 6-like n=1 Tax=Mya arenaria TaxID=6604 RepID=UPI0022E64218|nr:guanylate-binding protein 6-like [Mya arenaria]